MTPTFVLIPGAGTGPSAWDGVVAELRVRGFPAVAVDLPSADPAAGLPEYVDAAVAAVGARRDLVVVGQSLGAFTAAALCERVPVRLLVFLAGMVPAPGETPGDWWEHVGFRAAVPDVIARHGPPSTWGATALEDVFLHDVPATRRAWADTTVRPQTDAIFASPLSPSEVWPTVPTRVLLCRDDRFFPPDFQRRLARDRLGLVADETPGGHVAMLSRPEELAATLASFVDAP
jgi:pimeloyl-ACP methyl ester carboxylesterase